MVTYRNSCLALLSAVFWSLAAELSPAQAQALTFKVQLVWATNKPKTDDPALKGVDEDLKKKFKRVFKWQHYYEVESKDSEKPFTVKEGERIRRVLSDKCEIFVKNLGRSMVTVDLIGEGTRVNTIRQSAAVKDCLVIAGDDKDDTAWLVVLTPQ